MIEVSQIKNKKGEVIATLHTDSALTEEQMQQQAKAARSRVEFLAAESREMAKRLARHIPSSGDDRFNCLCGEVCASHSDWASHASDAVLLPNQPAG